jgi:hypothetical protein
LFVSPITAINVAEIEARANKILGPISSKEDAEIQERLGGTRDNCLFFGIHADDRLVTIADRKAQVKRASKKGGQGSSEAATPAARTKVINKRRGRGGGRGVSKRQRTAPVSTSEAVSSSLEESAHSKSDNETRPGEAGAGSGTNIEVPSACPTEEIVDIISLSPSAAIASATLVDPLNIDYSDPEPESDEDCAARARSSKDKSPIPPPLAVEVVVPSPTKAPGGSKIVSSIHQRTLTRMEQDGSSSETESDTRSGGVFVSSESPSVVAQCLDMKPNARIFGDSMRKVLQFCSDDRERTLLQEAGDSFGFPIMEDELGKESADEILHQAQDLSMKSFLTCRAAQQRCRADLRSWQLFEKTFATALNKKIDAVKTLQAEKVSLSSSLEAEKKKCLDISKEKMTWLRKMLNRKCN